MGFTGQVTNITVKSPELLGRRDLKIVSCHLGSGTSVAAILNGKSMDISSGLTPQSGPIMSTRPGDFDPWAILYVMEKEGSSVDEINRVLTKEAGLKGISGISGDLRDLKEAAAPEMKRHPLPFRFFFIRLRNILEHLPL